MSPPEVVVEARVSRTTRRRGERLGGDPFEGVVMSQAPARQARPGEQAATTDEPGVPASSVGPVPRAVAWTALAVCAAGVLMVLLGAWRTGISTDEPVHVMRYANLHEHGWYLLDDDFDGDAPGSWVTDQYVYGPVFTEITHGVNRLVGLDPAGALGTSLDAYVARHLLVAACALLATFAVAAIGRRVLGSWGWGLVAAGTLMAIPMWPGLAMFDTKDVPTAAGYTLVTLALVEMLVDDRSGWRRALAPAILAVGLVLGIGTRPGLWPGLAASLGLAVIVALRGWGGSTGVAPGRLLARIGLAGVAAYALLWLAYPAFFSRPDEWLLGSVLDSADYAAHPGGSNAGSWAYLPGRVVFLMPPLLLLVGVLGCLTSLPRRMPRVTPHLGGWLLVISQALLLPVLAVVRQSLLYDGLRQVLFAAPAVALLLTAGWRSFLGGLGKDSRVAMRVLGVVWAAALLVPVAVQVQLFPYAYTYAAPQAAQVQAVLEDDYWRLSYRELVPEIPPGGFVVCYPARSEQGKTMRYTPSTGRPAAENSADCRTDPAGSLAPFHLPVSEADGEEVQDTFLAVFNRGQAVGDNCRELASVTRGLYFSRRVMSTVARCDLVLNPYPPDGVELRPDGVGAEYLLGGWTAHPIRPGVQLRDPAGSLGFELPAGWDGADLRLRLMGESADVPDVRVNNEPVDVAAEGGAWVADVPASVAAAMGEGRIVVTLVAGDSPGLTLTRAQVERA
jgi:hypothetical protein